MTDHNGVFEHHGRNVIFHSDFPGSRSDLKNGELVQSETAGLVYISRDVRSTSCIGPPDSCLAKYRERAGSFFNGNNYCRDQLFGNVYLMPVYVCFVLYCVLIDACVCLLCSIFGY